MARFNKRTDHNQADIVKDLRKAGVQVILTNMGNDYPDLMVGSHGHWTLIEIKRPNGSFDRGQIEFMANATGQVGFATTSEEALQIVCRPDTACLGREQKSKLRFWLMRNNQESLNVNQFRKLLAET